MTTSEISPRHSMPVGYRFHPSDQEIIGHFLKNKILGNEHLVGDIPEVDICMHEPWELPDFSVVKSDDPEWFFFSTLDFSNGGRCNRKTKNGFWKPTGKDRKIKARGTNILIGTKKTLVFHRGCVRDAVRTKWMIYEYHSVNNQSRKPIYVVCRLMKKDDEKVEDENPDYGSQSRRRESDVPEIPMLPEENGASTITWLPLQEPNRDDSNWEEIKKFVDSATVDGCIEETNSAFNCFKQWQWNEINPFDYGRDKDLDMAGFLYEDLPPNSPLFGECSNWNFQPQSRMLRMEGGIMLQSHFLHVEQGKVLRRSEFSGQANSRRAENPIKANEASKYSPNNHPKKKEIAMRPPSEYFANFVIGIFLIIAFAREMVMYGQWRM